MMGALNYRTTPHHSQDSLPVPISTSILTYVLVQYEHSTFIWLFRWILHARHLNDPDSTWGQVTVTTCQLTIRHLMTILQHFQHIQLSFSFDCIAYFSVFHWILNSLYASSDPDYHVPPTSTNNLNHPDLDINWLRSFWSIILTFTTCISWELTWIYIFPI